LAKPGDFAILSGICKAWSIKAVNYVKILEIHFKGSSMKSTIQAVKGTREFYPADMAIRQWLYGKIRQVSEAFGYLEYDGPFLEKIDLYAAKSGEELVKEQAFVFQDRGGDLITLRPELTPSLARMIAQKQGELAFPARWWSFGPFWRYEKPQKGRSREFFQWNIDQIGANSPEADAELIAICGAFLKSTGLTPDEIQVKVNHRALMDEELSSLGVVTEGRKVVTRLIDRRDKMLSNQWDAAVLEAGITQTQLDGLKTLLGNRELWKKSEELTRIFESLKHYGLAEYVQYDPQIIRGLDYYTGVVFEVWEAHGEGRAVLGGGHYDNLVEDVGGQPLPGVGFAMGDVMITLLLQKYGRIPDLANYSSTVLMTVFDETLRGVSLELATRIRENGIPCICYSEEARLQKQIKYADRLQIPVAVVIGPDEAVSGAAAVRDLKHHTQQTVPMDQLIPLLRQILAGS
jgi:histidyl-tRNA synthetase